MLNIIVRQLKTYPKIITNPLPSSSSLLLEKKYCHINFHQHNHNNNNNNNNEQPEHSTKPVRVRFAPSPTGYLHLGGLRTALYNYLFARANNGRFILRIEDTDQSRLVAGATEQLSKDLEWAGIIPDEGPEHVGPYGPYIQTQRLDLYSREVKKLIENGSAYHCFCTNRRIEMLRKEAVKQQQIPKYDNRCRSLTPIQIAQKLANNERFCIRFKLDPSYDEFQDMIYGKLTHDVAENEGDLVIIKSDGLPTYHFAHVVDDHFMEISHVLRGVEWQISTNKHLLLYKAFGWIPPLYGHLPLIVNADGSKLSKRQGNINIEHFRQEMGIRPLALINFITQSGGGFDRKQFLKPKCHSMDELQQMFDVNKINVNASRLNPLLLDDLNRLELMKELQDENKINKLITEVKELVLQSYPESKNILNVDNEHIKNILIWGIPRVSSLQELVTGELLFVWVLPTINRGDINLEKDLINDLVKQLENQDFKKDTLNVFLKEFSINKNIKYKNLMKSLRMVLSGLKDGPGVAEMMEILGKTSSIQRILNSIKNIK